MPLRVGFDLDGTVADMYSALHDEALKQLKAEVTALKRSDGAGARLDVATFKERFGVTRKFAIPLLEYLDRERVTRRVGESRVVL